MGRKVCHTYPRGENILIFSETLLNGVYIIELEKNEDERGFFLRTWDKKEFELHGLNTKLSQCSVSYNKKKGTIRGMHYQIAPFEETKLVRCTNGSIFDVTLDIRPNSPTFKKWIGVSLSAENYKMIYIPEGVAHGFQTLENDTEVFYQISQEYMQDYARGVRWDDPVFQISWPLEVSTISNRDRSFEFFKEIQY